MQISNGINAKFCSGAPASGAGVSSSSNRTITLSVLGGVVATIPSTVLAYIAASKGENVHHVLRVFFAGFVFTSLTATRSLSTADFINMVSEHVENLGHNATLKQRKNFLTAVKRVLNALEKMPDGKIELLHDKYLPATTASQSGTGAAVLRSYSLPTSYGTTPSSAAGPTTYKKCTIL